MFLGMLDPGDQRSQLGNELKWHGVWGVVHIWEATWAWAESKTYP